ncbi:hypothetical protein AMS68_007410 [Peltaster fructicola]|uniref:Fe2OG dioxygenase domain-containing protein n=1 Tax=Peltaster fructicola TaxID=286661 RepID=A0A6H0Y4H0_9PEZI|nr:hypothetical protein AMS68_007410 [Peltaster fructicola]
MLHAEEPSTEFTPDEYPPFPDDASFPTFDLETIDLKRLVQHDEAEQRRVFEACKTRGFFYLDLAGCESGEAILHGADNICRVAERFFALPVDEKSKYKILPGCLDGYKCVGATRTDKSGTPDTAEFFNIAKNDFILPEGAKMSRDWPELIVREQPLFNTYMRAAHSTGMLIMDILMQNLGIAPEELRSRHRLEKPAGDIIRLTRGPPRKDAAMPEVQTPSHTDFGTITVLMNWLGGLQISSASARTAGDHEPDISGKWLWVKPKKGCAIINLGDASVKFTNGALCSGRHRVLPAPGEQGKWPRYSIVYFVRPENDCILQRLDGEGVPPLRDGEEDEAVTAKDWIVRQASKLGQQFTDN